MAIFDQADDILSIIKSSTDATMGPDTEEPENSMLENASNTNRWKVGWIEGGFQCYGCFQYVSLSSSIARVRGRGRPVLTDISFSRCVEFVGDVTTARISISASNATGPKKILIPATLLRR